MLFLLFGGGHRIKPLGDGAVRDCPRCHNTTTWMRARSFYELTFFFLPILRWRRRELEACPICGEAASRSGARLRPLRDDRDLAHPSRPQPVAP